MAATLYKSFQRIRSWILPSRVQISRRNTTGQASPVSVITRVERSKRDLEPNFLQHLVASENSATLCCALPKNPNEVWNFPISGRPEADLTRSDGRDISPFRSHSADCGI